MRKLLLASLIFFLSFIVIAQEKTAEEKIKILKTYEPFYRYLEAKSRDKIYRFPTDENVKKYPVLYPNILFNENALSDYLSMSKVLILKNLPAGSTHSTEYYDGNKKVLKDWFKPQLKIIKLLPDILKKDLFIPECIYLRIAIFSPMRKLARVIADRGFIAELDNRPNTAAKYYLMNIEFAKQLSKNADSLEELVAYAIFGLGYTSLNSLLVNNKLSGDTLRNIIKVCSKSDLGARFFQIYKKNIALEIFLCKNMRIAIDSGKQEMPKKEAEFFLEIYKQYIGFYSKFIIDKPKTFLDYKKVYLNEKIVPKGDISLSMWFFLGKYESKKLMIKIHAALLLYEDDTRKFPEKLKELVPKYLTELPIDPFSGKAFIYKKEQFDVGWLLYSVGPDGKDNGGVRDSKKFLDPRKAKLGKMTGDIIYKTNVKSNIKRKSNK